MDYDTVFLQPARPASRLLETPQAVHYFLAIMTSAPNRSVFEGTPEVTKQHTYIEVRHILGLQGSEFIQVRRKLEQVAETITWVVRDLALYGGMVRKPSDFSNRSALSTRCEIAISKKFYKALLQAQDGEQKLGLQFLLAVAMIHELAHATMYALTEMPQEPIFGRFGATDAGWELEARLFGLYPHEPRMLSGELWWYGVVLSQPQNVQGEPTAIERVRVDFIQELFTDGFWQGRFLTEGPWKIIPSAAWQSGPYVPSSIRALTNSATMLGPLVHTQE